MEKKAINPKSICEPLFNAYSNGIAARGNRILFIAGQVAMDKNGKIIGIRDIRAQTRLVFENIKAIVEDAGGSMENIVKTTTFMTNLDDYYGYAEIRSQYFNKQPIPGGTVVEVKSLFPKDVLIEIEGIAVLD